jgi:methyl-accepting chemotaxis protein
METKKNEIVASIQSISASAEENSAVTEEMSANAQEQLQQVIQANEYVEALHELSENLRKAISTFTFSDDVSID